MTLITHTMYQSPIRSRLGGRRGPLHDGCKPLGESIMKSLRTLNLLLLCMLVGVFACGCPFNNDPCANVECDDGEVCENGECVAEPCETDDDCSQGFCSETLGNICVECILDTHCDDEDACTADTCGNALCSSDAIDCLTADDCPAGCNASCTDGACSD